MDKPTIHVIPGQWGRPTYSIQQDGQWWLTNNGRRRAWSSHQAAEEALILAGRDEELARWKRRAWAMHALAGRRRGGGLLQFTKDPAIHTNPYTPNVLVMPDHVAAAFSVQGESQVPSIQPPANDPEWVTDPTAPHTYTRKMGELDADFRARIKAGEGPAAPPKPTTRPKKRPKRRKPSQTPQAKARAYLDAHPRATNGEIAKALGITSAQVVQLIHGKVTA